jgi:MoaF C-terminal domain/MoaF N-terminal domain
MLKRAATAPVPIREKGNTPMTDQDAHDRQTFETQGSNFLRQNIAEKPEFDYAENRPPRSFRLEGRTLTLALRDSPMRFRLVFGDRDDLRVIGWEPGGAERSFQTSYEAFELAPDVFFVTYLTGEARSVAMALDLAKGVATAVMGEMTDGGIVTRVESCHTEEIATAEEPPYHEPFNLGGTRFLNTYAHNVAYEHIYLTGVYETWLGVRGPQAGQADTEEYRAFKIDEGIYFLYWNEGVLTAQMTFLFNFLAGNCVAEVFARVDGQVVHNTIGATTTLIHTKLPELPDVARVDVYSGD